MALKHRITINVLDSRGKIGTVFKEADVRLPVRLVRFLFGNFMQVYLLRLCQAVEPMDVKEVKEGGNGNLISETDSHFFINIQRLKKAKTQEFQRFYEIFHKFSVTKSWEDIKYVVLTNNTIRVSWKPSVEKETINSMNAAMEILTYFKNWVENNKGWDVIQRTCSKDREKIVQRIIHLSGLCYIQTNNLDMSCEPDEGRGFVDFKVSRGQDITIIEVKLSTNPNYCHGYETQIEEYGKAENTNKMIYVLIDMGNPGKVRTIQNIYAENLKSGKKTPEVLIINAAIRKSASVSKIF